MREYKTKPNGVFFIRAVSAVLLLTCLVFLVCGCGKKDPEDTSFYIAKDANGAEFRLGEKGKVIGRLELPKDEFDEYTGDMKLYYGEDIWMRVWQEDDNGVQKIYLQSPDGAMQLSAWADGDTPLRTKIRYNGAGDETASDRGVSLSMEFPQMNEDSGYLLFDISEDGTLQFNLSINRKASDTMIEQISECFIYRFTENEWGAKDRVSSVARLLQDTVNRELPSGTYTITVDITRDGETRQLQWIRTGLGKDGYRYLTACSRNGTQVARLQTLSDLQGNVTVENSSFAETPLFAADASGHVRRDGTTDLFTGLTAAYAFGYNGTVLTEQNPETLKTGTAAGFTTSLVRMDDIYAGERGEDAQLTRPKYRKYLCLRFADKLSNTTVDVPLAYGDWLTAAGAEPAAETSAAKISSQADTSGWELFCGSPAAGDGVDPVKVGTVKTETEIDFEKQIFAYSGDVTVTVPGASDMRLYRRCDGVTCYVYAEFSGYRWLLATCPAVDGEAPVLNVSRYTEAEDLTTPYTVYKMFYSVRLPDETEIAQFLKTDDGRLVVRLKADPTLADRDWKEADDSNADGDTQDGDAQGDAGETPDGSAQDSDAQGDAQDGSSDATEPTADQAFATCDLLNGSKPTDITLEYEFRIAAGGEAGLRPEDIVIFTSVSERVERNGTLIAAAIEKRSGAESDPVRIISDQGAKNADGYSFVCYDGTEEEASLSVDLTNDGKALFRRFTLTKRESGEKRSPLQVKGGLVYADDQCVDTLSAASLQSASGNGSAKEYRPFEEWTSYETEHLVIRLRNVREYVDAVKSQDGTVISKAMARRVVWMEVTERSSGNSWSFPVGYGSWQEIPER